jgi:SpoVK/Ycf46/Vps4 family AAA+-type ATPase
MAEALVKAKTNEEIKQVIDQDMSRVIGLHSIMKDLREYRNLAVTQIEHETCRGIWIWGPPETGKTHLARKGPWIKEDTSVYMK